MTEEQIEKDWKQLIQSLEKDFDQELDLNAVLFLIGVQELGKGSQNFTKEEKIDLMHIATCKLLSQSGYFELKHLDQDGWPHWEQIREIPHFNLLEQELLLKEEILKYFQTIH